MQPLVRLRQARNVTKLWGPRQGAFLDTPGYPFQVSRFRIQPPNRCCKPETGNQKLETGSV